MRSDAGVQSAYEAVKSARSNVETLRSQGASEKQIQTAEQKYQAAEESLYQAVSTAGQSKIEKAKSRFQEIQSSGIASSSAEYRAAEQNLRYATEQLSAYESAHSRIASGNESYNYAANQEAQRIRADDYFRNAENYDQIQKQGESLLNNTIETASVYAQAGALSNPKYKPADSSATRQMAYNVFSPSMADIKEGTSVNRVEITDLGQNSNNPGHFNNDGGRRISVSYTGRDDKPIVAEYYDAKAVTAMSEADRKQISFFTAADGSKWGVFKQSIDGMLNNPGEHIMAQPRGQQARISRQVSDFFTKISKKL